MRDVAILAVGGAIVALLALALQGYWPYGFPLTKVGGAASAAVVRLVSEIHSDGPLRINEIMSCNRRTLSAADGTSPDWVEIANISSQPVNLAGWSLAKTEASSVLFTFPDMTLEPGGCALVLADSRLRNDPGEALHAPFRLSSLGDTLMLFNATGVAMDSLNVPAMEPDASYVRTGTASWEFSTEPTPGMPNTPESRSLITEPGGGPVGISEILPANDFVLKDETGMYYDYIELYNHSSEAVDLKGWYLSDDAAEGRKWCFPSVSIDPGEYLVVFASGLNRTDDPAHLHTNFSLSSEGESVVLTDADGHMVERVDFGLVETRDAWSLGANGEWGSAAPSPGRANP